LRRKFCALIFPAAVAKIFVEIFFADRRSFPTARGRGRGTRVAVRAAGVAFVEDGV